MKKSLGLSIIATVVSVLSSSAFAGSYQIVVDLTGKPMNAYQKLSVSCPQKTWGPFEPTGTNFDGKTYSNYDPQRTSTGSRPLKTAISTARFQWVPADEYDLSPPADFKLSHTYDVKVNATVKRNNYGAAGSATIETDPYKIYGVSANSSDTSYDPPPLAQTPSYTNMDQGFRPGQLEAFDVTDSIGIKTSVNATAWPGTGGVVTVSSSASIETTELKVITSP